MKPFPGLSKRFDIKQISQTTIFVVAAFIAGFLLTLFFWKNPSLLVPTRTVNVEERALMIQSLEAASVATSTDISITETGRSEMIKALEAVSASQDAGDPTSDSGASSGSVRVSEEDRARMLKALESSR